MNGSKDFVKETKKGRKRNGFWTEKKRKTVVWMCKMRKGSENKKKERKKNETIETAVCRFIQQMVLQERRLRVMKENWNG